MSQPIPITLGVRAQFIPHTGFATSANSNRRARIAEIQLAVAKHYGVKLEELTSDCRDRYLSYPRQVAMYLAREITEQSLTVIAHWFHRHHTTVIHGINQVEKRAAQSRSLRNELSLLRERLGG